MKKSRYYIPKLMTAAISIAVYDIRDWSLDFAVFLTEKISNCTGLQAQPGLNGQTQTHLYADTMFKF